MPYRDMVNVVLLLMALPSLSAYVRNLAHTPIHGTHLEGALRVDSGCLTSRKGTKRNIHGDRQHDNRRQCFHLTVP
jgi:hypothetical protein